MPCQRHSIDTSYLGMGKLTAALVGQLCPGQALGEVQRLDASNKGLTEVRLGATRAPIDLHTPLACMLMPITAAREPCCPGAG